MQAKITQTLAQNIAPQSKVFRVNDTLLKDFVLLVRPSGKKPGLSTTRKRAVNGVTIELAKQICSLSLRQEN